jgi:hypothetical protein
MGVFENMGEVQLQRAEGDRLIATALLRGFRRLSRVAGHWVAVTLTHRAT